MSVVPSPCSRSLLALVLALSLLACAGRPATSRQQTDTGTTEAQVSSEQPIPPHLRNFPGLSIRVGDAIHDAPEPDQAVARGYPAWPDKGPLTNGRRITIMTAKVSYGVNDEVRIIHVVETLNPQDELYVMGPKPVRGEYVGGVLVTEPVPPGSNPLEPEGEYDGMVLSGPAVDYNYDITTYRFDAPGQHEIQWRLGELASNRLQMTITGTTPVEH